MIRTIWVDRPRIERRKISLTAVLSKIETFKTVMAAKYDHLMDDRILLQKCARVVKSLLLSRLHIMVLHRYHTSVVSLMPDRLRNIMVASGINLLEMSVTLETLPELKLWSWYSGALQQYHTAFLLLMEVFVNPKRKEADRIWNCLDFIFECDPSENREVKARKVLSELQRVRITLYNIPLLSNTSPIVTLVTYLFTCSSTSSKGLLRDTMQKTAVYQSIRGMRAPVTMDKHLGQLSPRHSESDVRPLELRSPPPQSSESADYVPDVQAVGRAPVQFAGVTNGEALWALPKQQQSPEASSDTNSAVRQPPLSLATPRVDDLMADIDWVSSS